MELNISEMRTKAAEQEAARAEEFRKFLEAAKERENKEHNKMQELFKKVGEKVALNHSASERDPICDHLKNMLHSLLD